MNIALPIYVESAPEPGRAEPVYRCPPFFPGIVGADLNLGRATTKLIKKLKPRLDQLGRESRHDQLAAYHFCPDIDAHQLKVTLDLDGRRVVRPARRRSEEIVG